MTPSTSPPRRHHALITVVASVLVGAAAAYVGAQTQQDQIQADERAELETLADNVEAEIRSRITTYQYGLRGMRAVVEALGPALSPIDVRRYMAGRDLRSEFKGSMGFGFIRRVPRESEAAFVAGVRAKRPEGFMIRTLEEHPGDRLVIEYIEPEAPNRAAVGLDIGSEDHRRQAAEAATRTGQTIITAPIMLVQKSRERDLGLLFLMPVYGEGKVPPPQQREEALLGWAYTPVMLSGVLGKESGFRPGCTVSVTDVGGPAPIVAFRSPGYQVEVVPEHAAQRNLHIFGRTWQVEFHATDLFASARALTPAAVALWSGLSGALGSFVLISGLFGRRRRFLANIDRDRLAAIVHHTSDAVFSRDLMGRIASWNDGATRALGYRAEEILGASIDLLAPTAAFRAVEAQVLDTRESRSVETAVRTKAGQTLTMATTVSAVLDPQDRPIAISILARDISKQRQAEAALRASEQRFRDLAEFIPLLIWTCDGDGKCDYLSPQWATYTGIEETVLLADGWLGPIHPEDFPELTKSWGESVSTGSTYEAQFRIRGRDGKYRWFHARAVPIRDTAGRVTKWFGSNTDIEELHQAQASLVELNQGLEARVATRTRELEETASQLNKAQGLANVGSWELRLSNQAATWSRELFRIMERDETKAPTPLDPQTMFPPAKAIEFDAALNALVTHGTPYELTTPLTLSSGRELQVVMRGEGVWNDERTQIVRAVGTVQDITAQHGVETALRAAEAHRRSIFSAAGLAMIVTDLEGTITVWNSAAEQMLQYTASEVVGQASPGLIHDPAEVQARYCEMEAEMGPLDSPFEVFVARARTGAVEAREWTYVRKDGTTLPVLLTVSGVRDEGGKLYGFLGVAADLSAQRKAAEEMVRLNGLLQERSAQAESANQAKSRFLASMSHEIRTPMNAIITAGYLLGRSELAPPQEDLLNAVQSASKTLLGMLNDILDLSKIEAGQLNVYAVRLGVRQVVKDVTAMLGNLADEKGLFLKVEVADSVVDDAMGDETRLAQILTNLIGNAIKFTDSGGITVRVSPIPEVAEGKFRLRFEVIDTGPGISTGDLSRIFSPFLQLEEQAVGVSPGSGLGLAIVRRLAELMGGTVTCKSTLGQGANFIAELSFGEVDLSAQPRRPSVLLVGDSAARAARLEHIGLSQESEVTTCAVGELAQVFALSTKPTKHFDALVFDAEGLEAGGAGLADQLMGPTGQPAIPVVLGLAAPEWTPSPALAGLTTRLLRTPATRSMVFEAIASELVASGQTWLTWSRPPTSHGGAPLEGLSVLVVDDHATNLQVARALLELEGAAVVTVNGGREAVRRVHDNPTRFDVVLMDIQMPDLDGIAATTAIRADPRVAKLPIFALSAGAMDDERRRAEEAGLDGFVTKPVNPETLISLLRKFVPTRLDSSSTPALALAAAGAWTPIPGIETAPAQQRFRGNHSTFMALLTAFLEDASAPHEPCPWQALGLPDLASEMHRVRGAAANLSATEVVRAARAVEDLAKAGVEAPARAAVSALTETLNQLRQFVALAAEAAPELAEGAPAAPVDTARLTHLQRRLRDQDFDAVPLYHALEPGLRTYLGASRAKQLRRAIDGLDFAAATSLLADENPNPA